MHFVIFPQNHFFQFLFHLILTVDIVYALTIAQERFSVLNGSLFDDHFYFYLFLYRIFALHLWSLSTTAFSVHIDSFHLNRYFNNSRRKFTSVVSEILLEVRSQKPLFLQVVKVEILFISCQPLFFHLFVIRLKLGEKIGKEQEKLLFSHFF